uniref:Uncharacterized protein n=1 Tax=Octopus bimaculoides TaxID=37653 RepID=A0A0L8FGS9_OCTBM
MKGNQLVEFDRISNYRLKGLMFIAYSTAPESLAKILNSHQPAIDIYHWYIQFTSR